MTKNFIISPSIMCSTPSEMERYAHAFEACGIDAIHFDVMDGHFVPNISFGAPVMKSIRKMSQMVFDVHLMISDPLRYRPSPDVYRSGGLCADSAARRRRLGQLPS